MLGKLTYNEYSQGLMVDEYPLVVCYIAIGNGYVSWVNPLFLWPFSEAMLNYQRVSIVACLKQLTISSRRGPKLVKHDPCGAGSCFGDTC